MNRRRSTVVVQAVHNRVMAAPPSHNVYKTQTHILNQRSQREKGDQREREREQKEEREREKPMRESGEQTEKRGADPGHDRPALKERGTKEQRRVVVGVRRQKQRKAMEFTVVAQVGSRRLLVAALWVRKPDCKEDGGSVDVKIPVKHVLSIELQLYFEKITDLTVSRSNSVIFNKALLSLATDAGLHPLVPYFIYFVAEEVTRNLNNFQLLFALMRLVRSLLQNPYLHIEPYLHQLMPSVMTCLVAKSLGNKLTDNHWELRNFTANLVALIFRRFGYGYHNLQLRVTRTLLHCFLDPAKALSQHYGAIKAITAIGPQV
ncbi:hypothetical protein M8C21_017317, partial [Ambrosia artemisiifolia]